jgi:hypothetical protein
VWLFWVPRCISVLSLLFLSTASKMEQCVTHGLTASGGGTKPAEDPGLEWRSDVSHNSAITWSYVLGSDVCSTPDNR